MNVDLVPIGEVDPGVLHELKYGLKAIFGCPVQIRRTITIADGSFDPDRSQHLSDTLLDGLRKLEHKSAHLLGVTEVNIFTHGLNFVFGQADSAGHVAVISLYQLRGENCGLPADGKLLIERSLKEAVHELGHTMGLGHCRDGNCVMHFSNSLIDTDIKSCYLCSRCQPKLMV